MARAMTLDYKSHPAELVDGGSIAAGNLTIDDLRKVIPARCFRSSYLRSLWYLSRDLCLAAIVSRFAYLYVPLIENNCVRFMIWAVYGWLQGLIFTGLWVLAHECGHGALFPSKIINDVIGFVLHSAMLTPYFAWRSSHRRHHIYANNMQLDHNYVPPRRAAYMQAFWGKLQRVEDVTEDAPIVTLLRLTVQQIFGFPFYLLNNITASPTSLPRVPSKLFFVNGHFNPFGPLFRPAEAHLILLSDIGVLAAAAAVYLLSIRIGSAWTMLLYLQPYVWVNHWIVAITYLHHTHPNLPKFEHQSWTFLKGALATIDRDFGLIGKYFFHGIIEFHVVHHLFSRIPFYHAEEATKAIVPLLGEDYRSDKMRWFLPSLWESFTKCQWVEPDAVANPQDQALWYRSGPSPPPQLAMIKLD